MQTAKVIPETVQDRDVVTTDQLIRSDARFIE